MNKGSNNSTLTLSHANSYSGGTVVSAGTVVANSATALGTGPVTVNSATTVSYSTGGSVAWGNAFTLAGGTIRHFAASGTTLALGGGLNLTSNSFFRIKIHDPGCQIDINSNPITGSGGFMLTDENVGTSGTVGSPVLSLSVGGNSYMGDTTIASGTVLMNVANALPSGTGKGDVILDGATNVAGTLDLNGRDTSINGLFGTNNAVLGMVTNSSASAATLTVGYADITSGFSGILGGPLTLTKTGTGTLTLAGANTYSGATTITGGGPWRLAAPARWAKERMRRISPTTQPWFTAVRRRRLCRAPSPAAAR